MSRFNQNGGDEAAKKSNMGLARFDADIQDKGKIKNRSYSIIQTATVTTCRRTKLAII